jgi:hypothetical protein
MPRGAKRDPIATAERHCVKCGEVASEMDHRQGGNYGRCDCLSCNRHGDGRGNLEMLCVPCHRPVPGGLCGSKHK